MRISNLFVAIAFAGTCCLPAYAAGDAKHIPGIFVGGTHIDSETDFTFGFEYEYKFNKQWGLGAVYERTNDAHHGDGVGVWVASLYYHPSYNIRLGIGAGEEKVGGGHPHTESLIRVSAAYDFHIGNYGVAPTIAADFVDGNEAIVFGVAFTRPF